MTIKHIEGKISYSTGLITTLSTTSPEAVLHQRVEDTTNTERRLNDVGHKLAGVLNSLAELDGNRVLADLDLAVGNTSNLEGDAAVVAQLLGKLLSLLLWCGQESSLDSLGILLELRTKLLPLDIDLPLLNDKRSLTLLTHNQGSTGLLGVHAQIVGTSVGTANTLDPARAGEKLSVPAITSVVGHLVGHVLTETQLGHVDTNLLQELVNTGEEVTQSLVIHETFLNSLANLDSSGFSLTRQLGITVEKDELNILNLVESVVLLAALRVDEVLDLRHEEFTDSQQTGARGDLVTV